MGNIKQFPLYGLVTIMLLISCKPQSGSGSDERKIFINYERPYLSEELKRVSIDFIDSFNLNNCIIQVTIEKKSLSGTYLILTCKGIYYFEAMKEKPLFTYELKGNSFFVFTGAEDLLDSTYVPDEFRERREENCDDDVRSCYWFKDGKMIEDKACNFPYPFSDIKMSYPPMKK